MFIFNKAQIKLSKLFSFRKNEALSTRGEGGFTFVEFIVILGIFAVMTGVALFNFRGFDRGITLQNLSHDIALELKTAQTLGVSAVGDNVDSSTAQIVSVQFRSVDEGFAPSFSTFRERDGGGAGYYQEGSDLIVRSSSLSGGYISLIESCNGTECDPIIGEDIYVSFKRPNPEPIISSDSAVCGNNAVLGDFDVLARCSGSLHISVVDSKDPSFSKKIILEPSGYIHVDQSSSN